MHKSIEIWLHFSRVSKTVLQPKRIFRQLPFFIIHVKRSTADIALLQKIFYKPRFGYKIEIVRYIKWTGLGCLTLLAAAVGILAAQYILSLPLPRPQVSGAVVLPLPTSPASTATATNPTPIITRTPPALYTHTPTPTRALRMVKLYFFYDANLNGKRDKQEPLLEPPAIEINHVGKNSMGELHVAANSKIDLSIRGTAPNGKPLTYATTHEPHRVQKLPELEIQTTDNEVWIGLADGFLTSPITPEDTAPEFILRSKGDAQFLGKYFPEDWVFPVNAYVYGYRIPDGANQGSPHLALDIWAYPGTNVHAAAGGTVNTVTQDAVVMQGEYGYLVYMHLIPRVQVGDKIKRYDIIGAVQDGDLKHVHLQLEPDRANILAAFPGIAAEYILKEFHDDTDFPFLPYFGP